MSVITLDYSFNLGMMVGILFADGNEREDNDIEWGVLIGLGPISLYLEKPID